MQVRKDDGIGENHVPQSNCSPDISEAPAARCNAGLPSTGSGEPLALAERCAATCSRNSGISYSALFLYALAFARYSAKAVGSSSFSTPSSILLKLVSTTPSFFSVIHCAL